MKKYICKDNSRGYLNVLKVGEVYQGVTEPAIFAGESYLRIYDDNGVQIAAAHLSRFEEVKEENDNE